MAALALHIHIRYLCSDSTLTGAEPRGLEPQHRLRQGTQPGCPETETATGHDPTAAAANCAPCASSCSRGYSEATSRQRRLTTRAAICLLHTILLCIGMCAVLLGVHSVVRCSPYAILLHFVTAILSPRTLLPILCLYAHCLLLLLLLHTRTVMLHSIHTILLVIQAAVLHHLRTLMLCMTAVLLCTLCAVLLLHTATMLLCTQPVAVRVAVMVLHRPAHA